MVSFIFSGLIFKNMNRLFIIGNGFDLAQGLPTSYNHFIDDFWINLKARYKEEAIKKLVFVSESNDVFLKINTIENYDDVIVNIKERAKEYSQFYDASKHEYYVAKNRYQPIFKFQNDFFKHINIKKSIQNWVDIENEYYKKLKAIAQSAKASIEPAKSQVIKLNEEFEQIKLLLEQYLIDEVVNKFELYSNNNPQKWTKIYNILRPISIYNNEATLLEEFTSHEDKTEIQNIFNIEKIERQSNKPFSLLLNFNYTPSLGIYLDTLKKSKVNFSISHIHGHLNDSLNRINFGFGDEMDEDYKAIENVDDNEYLKFFKSFQYSETKNYHGILNYINGNKFQVCILGHSCGLSDRTLLNTIFEHENCRSIKVYYYEKGEIDNYTDIIQNISRHFDDKKKMREKLVPKVLSSPFPQEFKFTKKAVAS